MSEKVLFSAHLDPAWEAEPVSMGDNGEIIFVDKDGEFFALTGRDGNVYREERTKPKGAHNARFKDVIGALDDLRAAAEKHDVTDDALLSLIGGTPQDEGQNKRII